MFKRRWYYFTLHFKAPKHSDLHSVSVRFETSRMGMNRINNIKAGEMANGLPVDAELVGLIHHGRMTELQWEKEI